MAVAAAAEVAELMVALSRKVEKNSEWHFRKYLCFLHSSFSSCDYPGTRKLLLLQFLSLCHFFSFESFHVFQPKDKSLVPAVEAEAAVQAEELPIRFH